MPARRRKVRIKSKLNLKKLLVYVILGIVFISLIGFTKLSQKNWNGEDKLTLVIRGEENVNIAIFDPKQAEIINIIIPDNTEVDVAEQKGIYKIQNIWELGENSKLGGNLLSRSVTKHFKLPVYLWADKYALGFLESNPTRLAKTLFYPYSTNLSLGDKFGLALFSLSVKNPKRSDIDFIESDYVKEKELLDGTTGYVTMGDLPPGISSLFPMSGMSENIYRIMIRDATGQFGLSEEVTKILEVLGGKVVSIVKEKEADGVCELRGKNQETLEVIAKLLPCSVKKDSATNIDIEVYLGKDFGERY